MKIKLIKKIKSIIKPFINILFSLFVREFIKQKYSKQDAINDDLSEKEKKVLNNNPLNRRSFYSNLSVCDNLLEIGCFDNPSLEFLKTSNRIIHYADYLSKKELINRAKNIKGRDPNNVPEIEYVLSKGFGQIERKYDAVVSNHCIEHVPDFILHLQQIHKILKGDGAYLFSVPDKRFCFDHFIPESTILDVLTAYLEKRKKPSLKSVLEHYCFTSQDWYFSDDPYEKSNPEQLNKINECLEIYKTNDYVDVHCWQFTPLSFTKIINKLSELQYIERPNSFKIFPSKDKSEFYVFINYSNKLLFNI
jgi:SAM-dependent methyltransferase